MPLKIKIIRSRYQPVKNKPDTFTCFVSVHLLDEDKAVSRGTMKFEQNFAVEDAIAEATLKLKREIFEFRASKTAKSVLSEAIRQVKTDNNDII